MLEKIKYLKQLAIAKANEEVDKAKIKWRKRKWRLPRNRTVARPVSHRPRPSVYYSILKKAGKNVCVCELCGSDYKITVHHKDGNPFNNKLKNLQVLCWHCHLLFHNPVEAGIHDELEGTKADLDPLNDKETRKFLGIIDEEKDI